MESAAKVHNFPENPCRNRPHVENRCRNTSQSWEKPPFQDAPGTIPLPLPIPSHLCPTQAQVLHEWLRKAKRAPGAENDATRPTSPSPSACTRARGWPRGRRTASQRVSKASGSGPGRFCRRACGPGIAPQSVRQVPTQGMKEGAKRGMQQCVKRNGIKQDTKQVAAACSAPFDKSPHGSGRYRGDLTSAQCTCRWS